MQLSYCLINGSRWNKEDISLRPRYTPETETGYWKGRIEEVIAQFNLPKDATIVIKGEVK